MSIFNVISGYMGYKASKAQAKQVQAGIREQRRQYNQTREDMMPWLEAGKKSLADLETELGSEYEQSRGYEWQRQEGEKALQSQMAALGMSNSGVHMKAAQQWGQGLAAQDYDKWYSRKAQLAGQGQQQSASLGALGQNYANAVSKNYNFLGAVNGSGYAAIGNAVSNAGEQYAKMLGAGYGSIYQ